MEEKKLGKLEMLIRAEANKTLANNVMNDLSQLENWHHNQICKQLVELSDKNNFPMTLLVYVAVGTSAHKPLVFEKKYHRIERERAEMVIKLCDIFAKRFGNKWRTNEKLVHMVCRYLDITKHRKELKFRQLVNDCCDINTIKIDSAKKLARNFFGNQAEYSNGGYIVSVNDCM